jgi:DNA (cytosine-5)-methyltransferase 1
MEVCPMADELLTVSQAANYLQLSEKTVRRLLSSNQLLASRVGNRSWRIKKADIDEYLSSHTNSAKNSPNIERKYNVIDLFCGAGGLHTG